MKTNKLDKNIKEKFVNRTFKPSASAWERLSAQLDEEPQQKKKGWFFYIGVAASILLLISIGFQISYDDSVEIIPKNEVVTIPIDKTFDKFVNEIPFEKSLVKVDEVLEKLKLNTEINTVISLKEESQGKKIKREIPKLKQRVVVAQVEKERVDIIDKPSKNKEIKTNKNALQQNPNSSIKINSDDLLYAVTHSPKEVKAYYAKYNVNRDDVLRTIKSELKKLNIKVNLNLILAEVERNIIEDDFQNNFMKSIKRKVSDFAIALASRND
tara:strand:+ start:768 stop:1574 length:807 start_codon:yes stop_codon:yes gene_type:complete